MAAASTAATAAPTSTTPTMTPEEIARNFVYACDVHEMQLREMRKDPEELIRLTKESLNTPLAGYTKLPSQAQRDDFFTKMKALCEREPTNPAEQYERMRAARAIVNVSMIVDLRRLNSVAAVHRVMALQNEGMKRLKWSNPAPTHPPGSTEARSDAARPTRMAPVMERRAAKPLARPAGKVTKKRVTKKQLTAFRRNPYLLRGKRFFGCHAAPAARAPKAESGDGLAYKIVGLLFPDEEQVVQVHFEGSRAPEELLMDEVMDMVAESELVEGVSEESEQKA